MSQSPLEANPTAEAAVPYQQGWKALNKLLHEDRSFSGGERNCAYLNLGGSGFADISAASGVDFPDDARAVVATDWDFDGDLDLWITCRTAPRLRLLQNRAGATAGSWLAVRPEGDGIKVNRDGVGALVEVWLQGQAVPLVRTVHAGDAFLSQTGSWLHFGIGTGTQVSKLVVRWPGGTAEEVTGAAPGGFYRIKIGSGVARQWQPPQDRKPLVAAAQTRLADAETARIVLQARLPLPEVEALRDLRGPLLLNLWSASCAPCVAELAEWSEEIGRLQAAGVRVLALNADGDAAAGETFNIDTGVASANVVLALDLFQRAMLDRWIPLPVPSSFMIDRAGKVAVIYKGRVSVAQILRDRQLLDAPPESWRNAALPFPGRFIGDPAKPEAARVATQFIDADAPRAGLQYLERYAAGNKIGDDERNLIALLSREIAPLDPGSALLAKADALRDSGDTAAAVAAYKATLGKSPKTLAAAEHLAWLLAAHPDPAVRTPPEALALASRLCAISNNQNPAYLDLLGAAQAASGDFAAAQKSALAALQLLGDSPAAEAVRQRLALYRNGNAFVK